MKRKGNEVGLRLFAKFTVEGILQDPQYQGMNSNLDVVELFSGSETLTKASRHAGWRTAPFDILRNPREDLTTEAGFLIALALVMRLRKGGLLWMGVKCSSWTFPNSSNCQRKQGAVDGNLSYQPVLDGNLMADVAAFFMILCIDRGVECVVENPSGSQLFTYLRRYLRQHTLFAQVCHRCAYDSAPFPRIGPKPYKFLATGTWIRGVNRKCQCPEPMEGNQQKHVKCMEKNEVGSTSGTPAMAESAAYPKELADHILKAWCPGVQVPISNSGIQAKKQSRRSGTQRSSDSSGAWGSDAEPVTKKTSKTAKAGVQNFSQSFGPMTRETKTRKGSGGSSGAWSSDGDRCKKSVMMRGKQTGSSESDSGGAWSD